ncbi:MAG: LLM class flavin-dependent oxidoreductase [Candidatus Rokubacteria bacterium]|nr:LLM class flavin-dependent oxidoreductase [Candidatus Rokubacteria bacterium]
MVRLRFGVALNLHRPETLLPLAEQVEALGYESLWAGDHISYTRPILDPLTLLASYAARTRRVRLGTCVYLLPLRHPTPVAKAVASLDFLSGGRVVFGVGVGGEFPKEFEACGVPREERGRRTDEGIEVLRRLWRDSPASFEGKHFRFDGVTIEPKPAQPGGPPILVGGRSDFALRRAGRLGDGWISYLVAPDRYRRSLDKIEGFAAEAGRRLERFEPAHLTFIAMDDDPETARETAARHLTRRYDQPFDELVERYCVLGPPEACAERIAAFAEAGVETFVLNFVVDSQREAEQIEAFAAEVLPRFRSG